MAYVQLAQLTGCASTAGRSCKTSAGASPGGRRRTRWTPLDLAAQGARAPEAWAAAENTPTAARSDWLRLACWLDRSWARTSATGRNRSWYYRPGPNCPSSCWANHRPRRANHCSRHGQSKQQPTFTSNNKNGNANAQNEQPHPIPDATATRQRIARPRRRWCLCLRLRACYRDRERGRQGLLFRLRLMNPKLSL